mmetsp:Transcript_31919/g.98812  ORF Transcript_31919/g.98812 Transcript_31919/m.98812 type:complete len:218 (-) Transcript_31919:18-671(-)
MICPRPFSGPKMRVSSACEMVSTRLLTRTVLRSKSLRGPPGAAPAAPGPPAAAFGSFLRIFWRSAHVIGAPPVGEPAGDAPGLPAVAAAAAAAPVLPPFSMSSRLSFCRCAVSGTSTRRLAELCSIVRTSSLHAFSSGSTLPSSRKTGFSFAVMSLLPSAASPNFFHVRLRTSTIVAGRSTMRLTSFFFGSVGEVGELGLLLLTSAHALLGMAGLHQ